MLFLPGINHNISNQVFYVSGVEATCNIFIAQSCYCTHFEMYFPVMMSSVKLSIFFYHTKLVDKVGFSFVFIALEMPA